MKTERIRQYISHFCKILGITSTRKKKKKGSSYKNGSNTEKDQKDHGKVKRAYAADKNSNICVAKC